MKNPFKKHKTISLEEWLAKAEKEEAIGRTTLRSGRHLTRACYHFHLMAEHLLNALLAFYGGKQIMNLHKLSMFSAEIEILNPEVKKYEHDFELLDPYYIDIHEGRFPYNTLEFDYARHLVLPEINQEGAEKLYEATLHIKEFVLQNINRGKKSQ